MAATNARDFGNVRKLPSGRYQARYRGPDGVRYPAPTTFTTKKAANAWLSDVQSDIERGRWKSPEQLAADDALTAALRAEVLTVAELANVWMETIPSDNHRTLSASRVRRFINPELGDIKIDELSRERCEQWYRDMNETLCPGAPTQVRRTFAALHAMLKLAVHMIDRNFSAANQGSPHRCPGARAADRNSRRSGPTRSCDAGRVGDGGADCGMVHVAGWRGSRPSDR